MAGRSERESLIEALAQPAILVAADVRVEFANAAARELLPALRPGETLLRALRSPDVLDALARVRAGGAAEVARWRERVPVDRVFDVRVAPVGQAGGAMLLTLRDLTEAHRVERMRRDFVANASHELRTPLASILGFVETLQGPAREDAAARARFLAIMHGQATRMARLIDDLLSLSRIEQHIHLRPAGQVDLAEIVGQVVDALHPLAEERGARVTVDAPEALVVAGDRDELVRVVENLVENAIKYGCPRPGDAVVVTLATLAGSAVLTVSDGGPGIAPEHLPRLTERFYRIDAGDSRARGGTGLGLALVKHIVARHRGMLGIDSRLGEGTAFRVTIPLAQTETGVAETG